jgi:hypothetical protein
MEGFIFFTPIFEFPLLGRGVGVRPNKDYMYKSATPMKLNKEIWPGSKK